MDAPIISTTERLDWVPESRTCLCVDLPVSASAASMEEADSQSSRIGSRDVTPDTSLSQRIEGGEFKKPRKRGRPVELHQ